MSVLAFILLFLAALFAVVGLSGGAVFVALLMLFGAPRELVPLVSLSCSLFVSLTNIFAFQRNHLFDWWRISPVLCISVPAAFAAGYTETPGCIVIFVLVAVLVLGAILGLVETVLNRFSTLAQCNRSLFTITSISGLIAYFCALIGSGGGVLIAPIMRLLKWDEPNRIAAFASAFIACNATAALGGNLLAMSSPPDLRVLMSWMLPAVGASLLGGLCGRFLFGRWANARLTHAAVALSMFVVLGVVATKLLPQTCNEFQQLGWTQIWSE